MDDHKERVRQWAYRLWQEEGCPEGRETAHWDKARAIVADEDNGQSTIVPAQEPAGDTAEQAQSQKS